MVNKHIDTNNELVISRFGAGLKLLPPSHAKGNTVHTVAEVLALPFPTYFEDKSHLTKQCNDICAEACGFDSLNECVGVEWFKPFVKKTVVQSIANDRSIVNNNQFNIFEELAIRSDGVNIHTLSFRMPWYSADNNIIGLFGCSILLDKNPLAESIAAIHSLGLLQQPESHVFNLDSSKHPLTKREFDCLKLVIRGYSAKKSGEILGISQRTIEEYIGNIKRKFGATTKAELIDMTMGYFVS
jgi:DNA-binding CsgD family transcriptional regulator